MKPFIFALLIFPVLLKAQNSAPAAAEIPVRIFTLGDSNGAFAYGWPQQLKEAVPGAMVFNVSKSGKTIGFVNNGDSTLNALLTSATDLKKAAGFAGDAPFDYVVIGLGTNDAKAVFADEQNNVPKNLEALISRIRKCPYPSINKATIMIISPPPYGSKAEAQAKYTGGRSRVEKMSASFRTVARKNNCLFVDGFTPLSALMDDLSPDGLHMDARGQRKLADLAGAEITLNQKRRLKK